MTELDVKPGNIVVTIFGPKLLHWSIVSDKLCDFGRYMLISASSRTKTVQEEPQHIVTKGKYSYVVAETVTISVSERLSKARAHIGEWKYSLLNRNCGDFVNEVTGLNFTSQVTAGAVGAAAGVAIGSAAAALLSEEEHFIKENKGKIALGGLLLAGLAVWAASPPKE